MLRSIGLIGLLVSLLLLTGCLGGLETDEVTYVLAIGLDTAEENQVKVTYQIAIPMSIGTGGSGGSDKAPTELISVRAVNLAEARSLLGSAISRSINLSHVKAFIVGEDFARKGLGDVFGAIMRFREFRGTVFICVVNQGTAEEFLSKNSPKLESLPSKYYENMFATAGESGYYLSTQVHDFYRRLKTNNGSPFAVLVAINPLTGSGKVEGEREPGDKAFEYKAGNIPRQNESNPAEMMGTAVFVGDKMVGALTNQETRMIALLQEKISRVFLVAADPLVANKNVNVFIRLGRPPKIQCKLADERLKISIDILLEGEITSVSSGIGYEKSEYSAILEQQISQIIAQEMLRTLRKTQELGSDVVGFGYYARPRFQTYDEFVKADLAQLYTSAEITLSVKTTIRRTGLMWQTTPIIKTKQ